MSSPVSIQGSKNYHEFREGVGTKENNQKFTCFSICPRALPWVLIDQDVAAVLGIHSLHHLAVEESGQL